MLWCGSSKAIAFKSKTTISRHGVVQCLTVQRRYDCDIRRSQYLVEPVSGGSRRGAEYLALQCRSSTMMMQRRALAEPAQWSDQSPNMPPHPTPYSPTSSCPSSDSVWLPWTTVTCTFDFWDQQPPSCSLVLALSRVCFDQQLLFCLNIRMRSSNTEKNIW